MYWLHWTKELIIFSGPDKEAEWVWKLLWNLANTGYLANCSIPYLFFEQDKIIISMNTACCAYTHSTDIILYSDRSCNIA